MPGLCKALSPLKLPKPLAEYSEIPRLDQTQSNTATDLLDSASHTTDHATVSLGLGNETWTMWYCVSFYNINPNGKYGSIWFVLTPSNQQETQKQLIEESKKLITTQVNHTSSVKMLRTSIARAGMSRIRSPAFCQSFVTSHPMKAEGDTGALRSGGIASG